MKRVLLIFALLVTLFVSLTVATQAEYTSTISFGTSIYPDSEKIMNQK